MKLPFFNGSDLGTLKRSDSLEFSKTGISINGISSCVIALFALIIFVIASFISAKYEGNADMPVGALGISSAILCVLGLMLSGQGMKEKEVSFVLPVIGLGANGILFIYLMWLYLYGLI